MAEIPRRKGVADFPASARTTTIPAFLFKPILLMDEGRLVQSKLGVVARGTMVILRLNKIDSVPTPSFQDPSKSKNAATLQNTNRFIQEELESISRKMEEIRLSIITDKEISYIESLGKWLLDLVTGEDGDGDGDGDFRRKLLRTKPGRNDSMQIVWVLRKSRGAWEITFFPNGDGYHEAPTIQDAAKKAAESLGLELPDTFPQRPQGRRGTRLWRLLQALEKAA